MSSRPNIPIIPTVKVNPPLPSPNLIFPRPPILPKPSMSIVAPPLKPVGSIVIPSLKNPMILSGTPKRPVLNVVPPEQNPFDVGIVNLSEFQSEILWEAFEKKNGGLALSMGLGKTILSLLLGLLLRANGTSKNPSLIVVSKTLIPSWITEIDKFFGTSLKYAVYHKDYIKDLESWTPQDCDVVLITPQTLTKCYTDHDIGNRFEYLVEPEDFGPRIKHYRRPVEPFDTTPRGSHLFYSIRWSTLIVDEVQEYTNIGAIRCLAISALCAEYRWVLSGTLFQEPKPEKIMGYYLILDYPEVPRNLPEFKIMLYKDSFPGVKETFIERTKNEDYVEVPVNKVVISHPLTEEEGKIYMSIKKIIKELDRQLKEYKRVHDTENTKRMNSYMLGIITYLRQCVICPLIPITTVALNMADFECKSNLSEIFMAHIRELGLEYWLNNPHSLYSTRIQRAIELLPNHIDERVVIFSAFRTVLDVIQNYIPKDRPIFTITGNNTLQQRQRVLDQFNASTNGILCLTFDIGSNGLNLQAGSTVLIMDFWWNAGKASQAIARVLRRGQTRPVNIYYFTSGSGFENSLFKLQESKIRITEEIYDGPIKSKIPKLEFEKIMQFIDADDNITLLSNIYHTN
jgi:SNF2 family DNA or RNA helicase